MAELSVKTIQDFKDEVGLMRELSSNRSWAYNGEKHLFAFRGKFSFKTLSPA
jgi:hypothetical protein